MKFLLVAEAILLVTVLILMPLYSIYVSRGKQNLKGLSLPEGSIRGMLALISVGSFILFLVIGAGVAEIAEQFDTVVTSFGTLSGAIIGFYFGNRGSAAASSRSEGGQSVHENGEGETPTGGGAGEGAEEPGGGTTGGGAPRGA